MGPDDRSPRIGSPAFVCPHCKAFAQQKWFDLTADVPVHPPALQSVADVREMAVEAREAVKRGEEPDFPVSEFDAYIAALEAGLPQIVPIGYRSINLAVNNMQLSSCFVCKKVSVWVGDRVRFPVTNLEVPEPNGDLPADIRRDYAEAAEVVSASPRSAAALLRLAIQKLCSHLLEREGGINEMIGDLVSRGLSPMIQKALDVVRVVGNEAVHPGSIDLRDDQGTAMQLFGLTNLVAEAMITQPRHVMELYGTLPPDKVAGIEQRDAKAKKPGDLDS